MHGVFLQKARIFPGAHKIGAAISGARMTGKTFYGHEDFSESQFPLENTKSPHPENAGKLLKNCNLAHPELVLKITEND